MKKLRASVVSIRHQENPNSIVGTGFVIDARHIITCAHTVKDAGAVPGDRIPLAYAALDEMAYAEVASLFSEQDLAILRLLTPLPDQVYSVSPGSAPDEGVRRFRTFGYSPLDNHVEESHAAGEMAGILYPESKLPLLQLDSKQIDQGLSGAPVLDETTNRVVGIIIAKSSNDIGPNRDTAVAVPMQVVKRLWPSLSLEGTMDVTIGDFVEIPAGLFTMGSDAGDEHVHPNETPRHQQNVPTFYIGRYPVTNLEYASFVADAEHLPPSHWEGDAPSPELHDHPVVNVSYDDALAYCRWLSEKTGHPFRLPREEEWEKAARGTANARVYPWGNEWASFRCNSSESDHDTTTQVGTKDQANPYGVADMVGNVWEWTGSWYERYPGNRRRSLKYGRTYRVVRGGSYRHDKSICRVACRGRYKSETRRPYLGFRLASDTRPPHKRIVQTESPSHKSKSIQPPDQTLPSAGSSQDEPEVAEVDQAEFRKKLTEAFNHSELEDLAFDLDLYPDDFPHQRRGMARELIAACRRRGKLTDLLDLVKNERPHIDWE